jgi:hypothetical protein
MFARTTRTLAVSALIALGAAVATTAPAAAGGGFQVGIQIGGPGYGGPGYGGPGYKPWKPHYSTCKPYKAINKAHYYGIRKAYVSFANHKKVVVKGWKWGHPARAVFANSWACPVLAVY